MKNTDAYLKRKKAIYAEFVEQSLGLTGMIAYSFLIVIAGLLYPALAAIVFFLWRAILAILEFVFDFGWLDYLYNDTFSAGEFFTMIAGATASVGQTLPFIHNNYVAGTVFWIIIFSIVGFVILFRRRDVNLYNEIRRQLRNYGVCPSCQLMGSIVAGQRVDHRSYVVEGERERTEYRRRNDVRYARDIWEKTFTEHQPYTQYYHCIYCEHKYGEDGEETTELQPETNVVSDWYRV